METMDRLLTEAELEAGLERIRQAPKDRGVLELIVLRPQTEQRDVVAEATLDLQLGLVGDNWKTRGSSKTADGSANPEMQITLMNARVIDLVAGEKRFWPLAGDQLFVDLDLSEENLIPGNKLAIGDTIIEISAHPHTGCHKFAARFGAAATKFVNSPLGRKLQLRGLNAKIVKAGVVRTGDAVSKL
jgi:hypothetical protein